mmetsp:Transcript_59876/g.71309  ORF Transcript_59876/g.71309 Transcript_59876/m.71309 type:complete len:93 (-) Transcript_59876:470-748(-)
MIIGRWHLTTVEGKLPPDLARRLTKQRKVLRDVVKHMVTATKESTEKAAAKSTPIPSVKRWNEQQEVLRKKAVSGSNYPEQQMVKNFLKEHH